MQRGIFGVTPNVFVCVCVRCLWVHNCECGLRVEMLVAHATDSVSVSSVVSLCAIANRMRKSGSLLLSFDGIQPRSWTGTRTHTKHRTCWRCLCVVRWYINVSSAAQHLPALWCATNTWTGCEKDTLEHPTTHTEIEIDRERDERYLSRCARLHFKTAARKLQHVTDTHVNVWNTNTNGINVS